MKLQLDTLMSPLGTILLVHDDEAHLRALDFADHEERMQRLLRLHYGKVSLRPAPAPSRTSEALARYFDGDHLALANIPVQTGGTAFQRQVWAGLRTIRPGQTLSYGGLAAQIGSAGAMRAVGRANGANPVAIVVPCHRVIGANGTLTGFGGGLPRKQWLLQHEGASFAKGTP